MEIVHDLLAAGHRFGDIRGYTLAQVRLFHRAATARRLEDLAEGVMAGASFFSDGKDRKKVADGYRAAAKKILSEG